MTRPELALSLSAGYITHRDQFLSGTGFKEKMSHIVEDGSWLATCMCYTQRMGKRHQIPYSPDFAKWITIGAGGWTARVSLICLSISRISARRIFDV
jgi:hypothetical protein